MRRTVFSAGEFLRACKIIKYKGSFVNGIFSGQAFSGLKGRWSSPDGESKISASKEHARYKPFLHFSQNTPTNENGPWA
jgi:hypothetical protein